MHDSLLLCQHLLAVAIRALFISALVLFALSVVYILYGLALSHIHAHRSPLRNLPGPKNAHWRIGNFTDVQEQDSSRLQEEWVRTYGHVMVYRSGFGVRSLFLSFGWRSVSRSAERMTILPLAEGQAPFRRPCRGCVYSSEQRNIPKVGLSEIQFGHPHRSRYARWFLLGSD